MFTVAAALPPLTLPDDPRWAAADLFVETDPQGKIAHAEGAIELLGLSSPDDALGVPVMALVDADNAARLSSALDEGADGARFGPFLIQGDGRDFILSGRRSNPANRAATFALTRAARRAADPRREADVIWARLRQARLDALAAKIADRQFRLAAQPIWSLSQNDAHHAEILVRFDDGKSPAALIHLAEESGLIVDLDLAVVDACARAIAAAPESRFAVNISGRSVTSAGFAERFAALVRAQGIDPRQLIVEITESAEIIDLDAAAQVIRALRAAGHSICLDDFGAGAASFHYLRALEVDFIKIDGAYLRDCLDRPREAAILKAMVGLCRGLGVVPIVEMIETPEHVGAMRGLAVDLGQGYHFCRPQMRFDGFGRALDAGALR